MANDRRLLVFGTYDTKLHPRVAVLRDGLAARGWVVRELNEPLGASTADKVDAAGSPKAAAALAKKQAAAWKRLVGRSRAARASGGPDVVLVGYLGHADVHLARLLFPKATIVLDHLTGLAETVADRGLGDGAKLRALQSADNAAFAAADLVVVDTPEQAAALPPAARAKAVVVPVGAGQEWFEAAAQARRGTGERMKVVFFGLYTPLQGAPVIGEAIAALDGAAIDFTMIGSGQERAAAQAAAGDRANVTWLDWVDSDRLPALVAEHDVCLGIFGSGPKTARVIPTKVYQGMAAGCAVVTGSTPAVAALGSAVITVPVGDAGALAEALRRLASDGQVLGDARSRAAAAAESFSPVAAVAALDEALRDGSKRPSLPPLTLNAWLRWDVIRREVDRLDPRTVLEIGPGEGAMACRLATGRSYTGVEVSDRTRSITEERLAARGTPGRLLARLSDLAPQEQFDLVCAFEVLEHIDDDQAALQEWVGRVRPGGTLILSTPADPDRMGPHDVLAGHYRRYSAEQLTALAHACGLVDVTTVHVGFPAGYALEAVRNRAARDHPVVQAAQGEDLSPEDVAALTEQSSSIMQPPAWAGLATQAASAPARWAQRMQPGTGTGLVLIGRTRT